MLKPLELTIYPLELTFPAGYKLPRDMRITYRAADRMAAEKRLTEPELAAEYESARCDAMLMSYADYFWAPLGDTWSSDPATIDRRAQTMLRFATLPHYNEEVTQ